MKINNLKQLVMWSLALILFVSLTMPVISQGGVFRKGGPRGVLRPLYIEGYVLFHTNSNTFSSYIVLKHKGKHGVLARNASVYIDGQSLRRGTSGAFIGTVKARRTGGRIGAVGISPRRNNLNIRIRTGSGNLVTVNHNINRGATMKVVPVYRIGIDVGEPVTVFCTKPGNNRNNPELIVLNANNGNLVLKRIIRGDRYVIAPKKLPPRKTLLFRVQLYEGALQLNGNVTRGSYLNLYSGGEFRVNSHR